MMTSRKEILKLYNFPAYGYYPLTITVITSLNFTSSFFLCSHFTEGNEQFCSAQESEKVHSRLQLKLANASLPFQIDFNYENLSFKFSVKAE